MLRAILDWHVEGPRVIAATKEAVRETVVGGDAGLPGLLSWLPPWIPRSWQSSLGYAGLLNVDGREVSCISADAGANAIGSGAGLVLFDDFAKCVQVLGQGRAEAALEAAFKSLRRWPGKMLLPTTPDGTEMVLDLASAEGMRGVRVLDIGPAEHNRGNLAGGYLDDIMHNLRALDRWQKTGQGAFAHIAWPRLRVRQQEVPRLRRIIVFIDPAKSQRSHACKVGIVGVGIDARSTVYGLGNASAQRPPDGPQGWPAAAHDLADELAARYGIDSADVELGIECNTLGAAGPELLRAEERNRSAQRVAVRKIHAVTSKKGDPKTRRAAPVVALAEGNQVRMVVGLGEVESSLSGLKDEGTKADEADAFVYGARILAGLGDGKAADRAREQEQARAARLEAFAGFDEAQERMPAPAWGPPPGVEPTSPEWDRV
jgi:hypothetical protein